MTASWPGDPEVTTRIAPGDATEATTRITPDDDPEPTAWIAPGDDPEPTAWIAAGDDADEPEQSWSGVDPGATMQITAPPADPDPGRTGRRAMMIALGAGSATALGLGVYGGLHEPTFFAVNVAGFSSGIAAKSWLATGAVVLAVAQLATGLAMYGRLPGVTAPPWAGTAHRWTGRVAVLLTVPVAMHCLYALGLQYGEPRVLVHSLLGCLVYGAFVAKMLVLTRPDAPRASLPVLGGVLFTALVAVWLTSAVWFFTT